MTHSVISFKDNRAANRLDRNAHHTGAATLLDVSHLVRVALYPRAAIATNVVGMSFSPRQNIGHRLNSSPLIVGTPPLSDAFSVCWIGGAALTRPSVVLHAIIAMVCQSFLAMLLIVGTFISACTRLAVREFAVTARTVVMELRRRLDLATTRASLRLRVGQDNGYASLSAIPGPLMDPLAMFEVASQTLTSLDVVLVAVLGPYLTLSFLHALTVDGIVRVSLTATLSDALPLARFADRATGCAIAIQRLFDTATCACFWLIHGMNYTVKRSFAQRMVWSWG
jgi:hypothetical protein